MCSTRFERFGLVSMAVGAQVQKLALWCLLTISSRYHSITSALFSFLRLCYVLRCLNVSRCKFIFGHKVERLAWHMILRICNFGLRLES